MTAAEISLIRMRATEPVLKTMSGVHVKAILRRSREDVMALIAEVERLTAAVETQAAELIERDLAATGIGGCVPPCAKCAAYLKGGE